MQRPTIHRRTLEEVYRPLSEQERAECRRDRVFLEVYLMMQRIGATPAGAAKVAHRATLDAAP
jgi:hypothetical protein